MQVLNQVKGRFGLFQATPPEHRKNFNHLFWDMFWFGVLNGSSIAFLAIYATRLGATSNQLGLVNAGPALVVLIFSLPFGVWLQNKLIRRTVFWTSVFHRFFYFLFVIIPFFLKNDAQIVAIAIILFMMYIPGAGLTVGFTDLFAKTVPPEWRSYVTGGRNAISGIASVLMALICGFILNFVKFPYGYQIVFLMGALGAAMSSLALWKIHPPVEQSRDSDILFPKNFWGKEERAEKENPSVATVFNRMLNLDVLRSPYLRTLILLFGFHLTQYLAIPIFPIFLVNTIHLSDQFISFGQSLFNLSVFNGSLMHAKIAGRLGNKRAVGFGMILLAFYPFILAQAKGLPLYLVASLVGGFAWSVAGGALYNYLLERVPEAKRASYLAWFNVFAYTGILIGSLCGPVISNVMGIVAALFLFAGFRFLSGLSILRWG